MPRLVLTACGTGSLQSCRTLARNCMLVYCRLNFENDHLWQPFLGLSLLVLGFNAIGYLVLRFTRPRLLPLTPAPAKKSI